MTSDLIKPADEMRDLVASVHDYAKANLAPKTVINREAEFRHFREWCQARELPFLPSTPEVVCMYLAARIEGKVRIEWRGRGGELRSSTKPDVVRVLVQAAACRMAPEEFLVAAERGGGAP